MEIKKTKPTPGNFSEMKQSQEEIDSLQKRFGDFKECLDDFLDFLPLAVCVLNHLGMIVDANFAFSKLSKFEPDEFIGKPLTDFFLEKEELKKIFLETGQGKIVDGIEFTFLAKNKKEIPVNLFLGLKKNKNGVFAGSFVALFDITELKKLQENLEKKIKEKTEELKKSQVDLVNILKDVNEAREKAEEERDKTQAIISTFVDGILLFDTENKLLLINPQAEKILNLKKEEIMGKKISELIEFPNIKPVIVLLNKKINKISKEEVHLKENFVLKINVVPVMSGEQKLGTLIILHDVSREKLIEKMKTEFVSLAAHQLRTPLSAIKWTLRLILDGDVGEISLEQRDFLEKTYQSNERMISLINDLLNVARIEEGRYLYKPILIDLETVVQFVLDSYKDEIKKRDIDLEIKTPEIPMPPILLDVEKMKLAIQNLLDNAIRYSSPGGKVTISLEYDTKEAKFTIKDNGIGIPKDQQQRVFTKFFRASNAMKTETDGSGLGLFIVKNIIEAHGGKIWFESEENKGTTFYFTLPIKRDLQDF